MPVYAGEATPARALKCVQSGIFLPRFAIFRAVPISFGLRPARPSMDRRQMSRRACRVASSQTTSPDAQSGLAAKVRGVDQVRRPAAGDAARRSHYTVTLPERTSRQEQEDAPRNQPIVACVQIGSNFALRSVTRSGKRLKFLDRKGGRVV
jgi:hypothetical protein